MTYYELCENIRDLGFAEFSEIEEYETSGVNVISNNINRAITEINVSVANILGRYEFEIAEDDSGLLYIDMADVVDDFLSLSENPVQFRSNKTNKEIAELQEKADAGTATQEELERLAYLLARNEMYVRFFDYDTEGDSVIIIDQDKYKGSFKILYVAQHDMATSDIIDPETEMAQTILPLPLKAHHLVPLLASYYVWLDDDPTKASQYYNLYEQSRSEMLQTTKKLRGRIMSGGI